MAVNVLADDVPHELVPVTEIVPPVDDGVTVILLLVELPVQPDGSVQLYDVMLGSLVTE